MPLQAGDGVYFDGKSKGEPVCIAERLGIAAGLVQALADRLKQEAPQVRARVLAAIGEDRVSDVPLIPGLGGDWGARL